MHNAADLHFGDIYDQMVGHVGRFAFQCQVVTQNLQFTALVYADRFAGNGNRYIHFNDLIGCKELEVGMDDSVGYRMELHCLYEGTLHFAIGKAKVNDVRFSGVNQFVQFKLVDAD